MITASKRFKKRKSTLAVSAVVGSIIMIGVTLVVGFAAWAWASGAAQTSELNFGNAIASNLNYLKENFLIVNVNFSSSAPQNATIWIYNYGNATVYIKAIWVSNITSNSADKWNPAPFSNLNATVTTQFNCDCLVIHAQSLSLVTIQAPAQFASTIVYQFTALGEYGNTNSYQQAR